MKLFSSKLFIWALVLLVLCSVIIGFSIGTGKLSPLTNGASVVITPIQHALTTVSDFFNDLFGYFYRYNSLQEENAELNPASRNWSGKSGNTRPPSTKTNTCGSWPA